MGSDPSGKEVWISYKEEVTEDDGSTNTVDKKVQYKNGKLYNEDGKAYKGNNSFVTKSFDALKGFSNSNSSEFMTRLDLLVKSEFSYNITETNDRLSDFANSATPDNQDVFGAYGTPMGGTLLVSLQDINNGTSYSEFLSHEVFGHFYDYMTGNNDYEQCAPGVYKNDVRAVNMQNIQRIIEGKNPTDTYQGFKIPGQYLNDYMRK